MKKELKFEIRCVQQRTVFNTPGDGQLKAKDLTETLLIS